MRMKLLTAAVGIALTASPLVASAVSFQVPGSNTTLDVGGYAKLDVILNSTSVGDDSLFNHEFGPAGIPLDPQDPGEENQIVFNHRESRLWFKTATPTEGGDLKTHIEFDFDTADGNQAVSNSRHPRMRHAYGTYKNLLLGQTWSTFMYLPGIPETNDFGGPTGDIFVRQPQARFTFPMGGSNNLQLAFENPETFAVPSAAFGTGAITDDDKIPDIVVAYNTPTWSLAALARQLNIEAGTADTSASAYGVRFGWAIPVGNVKLQGMLTAGEGVGRYMSLGAHFDGFLDAAGDLQALKLVGGFAGVRIPAGANGRVNLVYGFTKADDPAELQATSLTEETQSVHLNYLWNATPQLRHGIELIHGTRETYNGGEGDLTRVQWSSRFVF